MKLFSSPPVNVNDFRDLARKRLPRMVFDYLDGGAEDETGLAHNRAAFARYRFRPRRLTNVSERSTQVSLFGKTITAPLLIAPTGINGLFWPDGDIVLAKAAQRAGIPFILSSASTTNIEDLARKAGGDRWFQLYVIHPDLADSLVGRALAADYSTLVLTVDVGVNGKRERDMRNDFGLPVRYTPRVLLDGARHPGWSLDLLRYGKPQLANFADAAHAGTEAQAALMSRKMDTSFDWAALQRLRDRWPRTLLVKGLLDANDARRCLEMGVDGVVLSNHGGRQLDSAVSPLDVLQASVASTQGKPVLIDSGFRRGSDVVKAVALGASGVLLGRAVLYGLAARGAEGVDAVLGLILSEIDNTMAQLGCATIGDLSKAMLMEQIHD